MNNIYNFSNGFIKGVGIYSAIPIVKSLYKNKKVESGVWKTSIAVGTFIGTIRTTKQIVKYLRQKYTNNTFIIFLNKHRKFIAGVVGAAFGLLIDDSFIGNLFVVWIGLKALKTMLPESKWGTMLLMMGATSIICPSAFLYRDEHQKQYQKFMDGMGFDLPRYTLIATEPPTMKPSIHGWNQWTLCDELNDSLGAHPNTSCLHSVLTYIVPRIFYKSLKIYAPLYLLINTLKGKFLNKYLLENILRSSIFLTGYTSTQYVMVMWYTSMINPKPTRAAHSSFSWLSGLCLLAERQERWSELTTYCSAQALNSLVLQMQKKNMIGDVPKYIYYIILILSSGFLIQNMERGKVKKILFK